MRAYTNEEFHKMHQLNLLDVMRDEVSAKLGIDVPETPPTGSYNINRVLDAEYFFQ
jgi:DNA-directed RNA polymerase